MVLDTSPTNSMYHPITVQPLNPHEIWHRHVKARRVVYLDTNIWVCLTDARTQLSKECLPLCREAVQSGAVIFPLSYASISELLDQPPDAPREIQAALMDELSLGITFRDAHLIEKEEYQIAFQLAKIISLSTALFYLLTDVTQPVIFAAHQKLNGWLSDRASISGQNGSSLF